MFIAFLHIDEVITLDEPELTKRLAHDEALYGLLTDD